MFIFRVTFSCHHLLSPLFDPYLSQRINLTHTSAQITAAFLGSLSNEFFLLFAVVKHSLRLNLLLCLFQHWHLPLEHHAEVFQVVWVRVLGYSTVYIGLLVCLHCLFSSPIDRCHYSSHRITISSRIPGLLKEYSMR